jgi:Glycosyltransferase family 87/WD40-like Beta Propeller Repeat
LWKPSAARSCKTASGRLGGGLRRSVPNQAEGSGKSQSSSTLAQGHEKRTGPGNGGGVTPWAEYLLLVVLVAVFIWRGLLPAWKSLNTDFPDYYLAASLYRQGYPLEQVYDWTWIQRQKDHAGIDSPIVAFALLTPFSLLPVLPFSSLPPLEAKRCWLLVNLVLLALTGWLLCGMTTLGPRRIAILTFLAIIPLRTNFLYGQEYVLLLFLLSLAARAYLERRPATSGAILGIAGALKIYPALFVFFFVRKRQWRAALALAAGSLVLWLFSIVLFGFETIRIYLVEVLPWPLRGEGQDPYSVGWNSLTALLHRVFIAEPELNPHPAVHLPAAYAFLQPICQGLIFVPFLWLMSSSRGENTREKLDWGCYVALLLILSTNPASYDFNGLILTAAFVFGYLLSTGRRREASAVIVLYAFVCFPIYHWIPRSPTGWQTLLAFPRLWGLMGLWICLLGVLARSSPQPLVSRLRSPEALIFGVMFFVLVAMGVTLNLRHLKGQFKNYETRLVSIPDSQLATDPATAGDKILFTTMIPEGYGTASFEKGSLTPLSFVSDSFHPATSPGSAMGWVELASRRSRIIRFPLDIAGLDFGSLKVDAENAEKPAVSQDERWLAFVRESTGRGSLWVKDLRPDAAERSTQLEWQLSPSDLDVLDVAFYATDRIVFSARRGGRPTLFTTAPYIREVSPEMPLLPRRFPAASPDGRWLAFSQLELSNWQLWIRDLRTHEERRLTDSDCNSVAPAWYPDSKTLVYATDCGRGFGLTALCRLQAVP